MITEEQLREDGISDAEIREWREAQFVRDAVEGIAARMQADLKRQAVLECLHEEMAYFLERPTLANLTRVRTLCGMYSSEWLAQNPEEMTDAKIFSAAFSEF